MHAGTLSRTRIFRTDPALDAAIAAAAEREGAASASDWIRRALASIVTASGSSSSVPSSLSPAPTHGPAPCI